MKNKLLVFAVAIVVILGAFAGGVYMFQQNQKEEINFLAEKHAEVFKRNYSPTLGNKDAKVFIIEFLDPECESCRAFHPRVKALMEEFSGKVQLVVRYAPFHQNSEIAIRALEASRKQNKYWEALDLLFQTQPEWGNHHNPQPDLIFEYLPRLGIDMDQLSKDMESFQIDNIIKQDSEDLQILGVRGTPTFFVNGKPLPRFSYQDLRNLVSQEVEKLYGK